MRILYVSRLFSGLAEGIRERRWDPRGVPTVYRLLEKLDQSEHDLQIVFTVKDDAVGWPGLKTETFSIDGFGRDITVIPQRVPLTAGLGRARGYLRELIQYREIRKQFDNFKPDLAYFDRVNVYQAALTARRTEVPVVWRVMGVPPAMHSMLDLNGPVPRITRKAYRAPFSMVICSRDGSGGEQWMDRALAPETPRKMMINGVTPESGGGLSPEITTLLEKDETSILFVARLVEDKGCLAFIDAVSAAMDAAPGRFRAFVAGSGPFEELMRERLKATGLANRVHFLGQVPHEQVLNLQQKCDIYVSLNQMCNLTNANLEAMRTGVCMIIPAAPGIRGIDVDTDELMPTDTIWRIRNSEDVAGLRDALIHLDSNPDERRQRAEAIFKRASTFIPSWDERVNAEMELLEQLAAAKT
jgi:glycosyltransferase involved in cell wall biosynthesis